MTKSIHRGGSVCLAFAAALVFAGAAGAQTAPAATPVASGPGSAAAAITPTPEAVALAGQIAHAWAQSAQSVLVDALMAKAPKLDDPKTVKLLGDRGPALYTSVREATLEAWTESKPHVEAILGHAMAEHFSLDELRAGAAFAQGPDEAYALEIFRFETAEQGKQKPLSKPAAEALARLDATDAGRQFLHDATGKDGLFKQCRPDLIAAILPPWLLRFSDKVDAVEAARGSQLAPDAYAPSADDQALGVSVVRDVYGLIDDSMWDKAMPAVVAAMNKKMAERQKVQMPRPEWNGFLAEAMLETLRDDKPAVEQAFGRALARLYDHDDLKALADFANGPGVRRLETKTGAGHAQDASAPAESAEEKAALADLKKRDLMAKAIAQFANFASTDPDKRQRMIALVLDIGVTLGPKVARRFATKAEALEAQTRAARGW